MKFITFYLLMLVLSVFLSNCGNTNRNKVKNFGTITAVNGMGKMDSLKFDCDSCEKYMPSFDAFQNVISTATQKAKESLKNPLSFIPRSFSFTLRLMDSLYNFSTNKKIDSCILIQGTYCCIGKNSYGVENEVKIPLAFFLIGSKINETIIDSIKKAPLVILAQEGIISREIKLYDVEGDGHFTILPTLTKPYSLIVNTSISCVDKGSILKLIFEDKSQLRLTSWNDFNCKGNSYFFLPIGAFELLKTKQIDYISFYSDKTQYAKVPVNDRDYFIQYCSLINEK